MEDKVKEIVDVIENNEDKIEEEFTKDEKKKMRGAAIGMIILVVIAFGIICYVSGLAGSWFGPIGENGVLGVCAILLIIGLYFTKKEM
ncbi:MAG: hypothetical protein MJ145_00975 [Clostridia bacterium]|nr:hypothetical protein [Clostridia bacterium]